VGLRRPDAWEDSQEEFKLLEFAMVLVLWASKMGSRTGLEGLLLVFVCALLFVLLLLVMFAFAVVCMFVFVVVFVAALVLDAEGDGGEAGGFVVRWEAEPFFSLLSSWRAGPGS